MKTVVCLYTGQGAVGNFDSYGFYTGQFSSCSPVVMYNQETHVGGLYHLPGKNGDEVGLQQEWSNNILKIAEKVKPTTVKLFPSGNGSASSGGFVTGPPLQYADKYGDRDYLQKMFTASGKIEVVVEQIGMLGIYVTADKGKLVIDKYKPSMGVKFCDLYHGNVPPNDCIIFSPPDMNYKLWVPATYQ